MDVELHVLEIVAVLVEVAAQELHLVELLAQELVEVFVVEAVRLGVELGVVVPALDVLGAAEVVPKDVQTHARAVALVVALEGVLVAIAVLEAALDVPEDALDAEDAEDAQHHVLDVLVVAGHVGQDVEV